MFVLIDLWNMQQCYLVSHTLLYLCQYFELGYIFIFSVFTLILVKLLVILSNKRVYIVFWFILVYIVLVFNLKLNENEKLPWQQCYLSISETLLLI